MNSTKNQKIPEDCFLEEVLKQDIYLSKTIFSKTIRLATSASQQKVGFHSKILKY